MGRKKKLQTDSLGDDFAVAFLSGVYDGLSLESKEEVATLFAHGFTSLSKTGIQLLRDCPDLLERVHSINPDLVI